MAHVSPFSAYRVCQAHSCLRVKQGFALRLFKSFLSQTGMLHFKHHCTKTWNSFPESVLLLTTENREKKYVTLQNTYTRPQEAMDECHCLSANGEGEI